MSLKKEKAVSSYVKQNYPQIEPAHPRPELQPSDKFGEQTHLVTTSVLGETDTRRTGETLSRVM